MNGFLPENVIYLIYRGIANMLIALLVEKNNPRLYTPNTLIVCVYGMVKPQCIS